MLSALLRKKRLACRVVDMSSSPKSDILSMIPEDTTGLSKRRRQILCGIACVDPGRNNLGSLQHAFLQQLEPALAGLSPSDPPFLLLAYFRLRPSGDIFFGQPGTGIDRNGSLDGRFLGGSRFRLAPSSRKAAENHVENLNAGKSGRRNCGHGFSGNSNGRSAPALAVAAGWITGLLLQNETSMAPEVARRASIASSISLSLLLLVIGCDLGRQRVWKKLREYGLFAATLPIVVGAATLVGSMAAALLFSMPLSKGLAAGAGFGWYSLAGPAALAKKGAETGAYVFLSNLIREISAIVLVPLISGRTHPEVAASLGGATSMDSSLPAISRSFGAEGAAWGLIVGTVLSLACPFVIELVLAI